MFANRFRKLFPKRKAHHPSAERGATGLAGLIHGKRVAIVGNAGSLLEKGLGPQIDQHDLVLRMNRGLPVDTAAQGSRTDVLAFSTMAVVEDVYQQYHADHLIWMSPKDRPSAADGIWFYELARWEALSSRLGARPSVGAMVLDLMSSMNPADVTIYGFDFKATPTFYQTSLHNGPHNFQAEGQFCRELVAERRWQLVV